jgi:GlpG protein
VIYHRLAVVPQEVFRTQSMPLSSSDRPLSSSPQPGRDSQPGYPARRGAPGFQFPPTGPVTLILIVACVVLSLWSNLGENTGKLLPFFISLSPYAAPEGLAEVRAGQVWRLFTPAFIHFGVLHLLFNMLGMQSLGSAVETQSGKRSYIALLALLACATDLAQYLAVGPAFGGMSGVLYGLFTYIWLRSVSDPASGFYMPRKTIVTALVWFVACFTGLLGPIANTAHTTGLILGAICGLVSGRVAVWRYRGWSAN